MATAASLALLSVCVNFVLRNRLTNLSTALLSDTTALQILHDISPPGQIGDTKQTEEEPQCLYFRVLKILKVVLRANICKYNT